MLPNPKDKRIVELEQQLVQALETNQKLQQPEKI